MRLLAGLVIAIVFTAVFRVALRKVPVVFYLLAFLCDALLIASSYLHVPPWFSEYVLFMFQSNTLGMGLFTIVMFTGVLDNALPLKKVLVSIRAELSIVASILCIGHAVKYGDSYLNQILGAATTMPAARLAATLVALILMLLLIPLAITSIKRVRAKMSPRSWGRLQKLAYVFYALIFVHIMLYLIPSSMGGGVTATVSVYAYLVLGLLYAILRVRQLQRSRETSAVPQQTPTEGVQ